MLFGVPLCVPGEFFVTQSIPANQPAFVKGLRTLVRAVKPIPASKHTKHHPFIFKDLKNFSHVFRHLDTIRKPIDPPYTQPHRVVKRVEEKTYVIDIKEQETCLSRVGRPTGRQKFATAFYIIFATRASDITIRTSPVIHQAQKVFVPLASSDGHWRGGGGARSTGAIEAQANLAASADLLILALLVIAATPPSSFSFRSALEG